MKYWSKKWKSSKKPSKQRKYRYNAPLHIRRKFLSVNLSKELRAKYKRRSVTICKGDKVKIMKGRFKKMVGTVERIDLRKGNVFVDVAKIEKADGTKTSYPLKPSNLMIVELNLNDKLRKSKIESKITKV
ncbi:MAG: 50S ribosomal protein L24 [Candidatus Parvarchaeota archaeon]|nr:50S ribosomal protein L24 [Candidatus Jingweiarchaeum tengchongense]MCW1297793.1 50S ribosomal protein L24 [Candidatus Jingweiarchaeum tengchongense]MCW1299803.1 50S ribosomal protein L24 [Candidatus Jingweiarchaeum tengchongense]MCW1304226.1 50S ribosomal protein L24 [Candidatus Jingweiarchaeum tengchongense]MCW1305254.1 50S ribosomal protein L24 [Candidatus Jingweiarchaeum tengchongense]